MVWNGSGKDDGLRRRLPHQRNHLDRQGPAPLQFCNVVCDDLERFNVRGERQISKSTLPRPSVTSLFTEKSMTYQPRLEMTSPNLAAPPFLFRTF